MAERQVYLVRRCCPVAPNRRFYRAKIALVFILDDVACWLTYKLPMTLAQSYLDELDQLLLDQPDECMLLTTLDGFLTGIIVSPTLIRPGEWLDHVWSGEEGGGSLELEDEDDFQHLLNLVMKHYNAILQALERPGEYEPVLDVDTRNGDVLWEMWLEGFRRAMNLDPDGWAKLAASDDVGCQAAVGGLKVSADIRAGKSSLSRKEQEQWGQNVPDLIPVWVEMLHAWRLKNDPNRPRSVGSRKVGRNDPCPCGSGKKYKKCCGLN